MAHTIKNKQKLLDRTKRIAGQVDAITRALEGEQECGEVLRLIASTRGAMNSLMAEVLEGHVRSHAFARATRGSKDAEAAEDVIGVIRAYLK
ncbi:MAG TPA: metal/formaldehyde-sensitive transcriptional repressor [Thermoanaerobaculia bacterium]|nr:metal/formaldehyde-sensitive transcriptional repressor [Thermoanaerobaculia bacterium]